ncbi:Chloramphenicol O-acetyltransferase [Vibrio cholerae]|nr:putative acetyltransferase [Vibrio cholerae]GHW26512.1 Chloramphenicol O-acetyltransferase [Vibrio cholerae]
MINMIKFVFKRIIFSLYRLKNKNKIWVECGIEIAKKSFHVRIGKHSVVDSLSTIGKYSYIGRNCKISKSTIGNYCSIGDNVTIGPGEHNIEASTLHRVGYSANAYDSLTEDQCIIGHDVWIGVDAIIMRGVTIGNGAVIGANSVVTRDIRPYSVAVGSPAREIKKRLDERKIEKLEQDKWWEKEYIEAQKYHKEFK